MHRKCLFMLFPAFLPYIVHLQMAPQREAQSWAHVRADGRVSVCSQHGAVKVVLACFCGISLPSLLPDAASECYVGDQYLSSDSA